MGDLSLHSKYPRRVPDARTPLVVTDLDGTVWDRDIVAHQDTLDAIAELGKRGIPVLAATGGSTFSVRASFAKNSLELPAVLLNGSLGYDYATGVTFHEHSFSPESANHVIDIFLDEGLQPAIYTADHTVHAGATPDTTERHFEEIEGVLTIADLATLTDHQKILVFATLGLAEERVAKAAERIDAIDGISPAYYQDYLFGGWSIMVQPPGISKWNGVQAWMATQDQTFGPVIAIGDGGNDPEMIAAADLGVAILGGDQRTVDAAQLHVAAPDRGGWAQILTILDGATNRLGA